MDFNAPESLVREADAVADLLDTSRTNLLVDGLRRQLEEVVRDEGFQRRLRDAFFRGQVSAETVATVLGTEEATRLELLREELGRELPVPEDADVPSADAFYEDEPATWTPDEASEDDGD